MSFPPQALGRPARTPEPIGHVGSSRQIGAWDGTSGSVTAEGGMMGEYTIASLSSFNTFPVYIEFINESQAYPAAALSLMSFVITWAAMLAILFVGRGRTRPALAGAR